MFDDEGLSLRRDYGFLEFSFNPGPEWVMALERVPRSWHQS
ncbi:hypothetical protein [Streptomyces lunaelactis]|nr:hypothetical protein [Streptomyces lunaelactis]